MAFKTALWEDTIWLWVKWHHRTTERAHNWEHITWWIDRVNIWERSMCLIKLRGTHRVWEASRKYPHIQTCIPTKIWPIYFVAYGQSLFSVSTMNIKYQYPQSLTHYSETTHSQNRWYRVVVSQTHLFKCWNPAIYIVAQLSKNTDISVSFGWGIPTLLPGSGFGEKGTTIPISFT